MIGDENGDDSVSMNIYSQKQMTIQFQANLTTQLLRRTVMDELMLTNRHS
jgi:hypothetical protein